MKIDLSILIEKIDRLDDRKALLIDSSHSPNGGLFQHGYDCLSIF
jgi:uncharacterized protein (UPF0335 family)